MERPARFTCRISGMILVVQASLLWLAASSPSQADYQPSRIPQSFSITTGSMQPGNRCVYGTKFPWYDRFGNFVTTLSGGFTVNCFGFPAQITASQITVTVNGNAATVTQVPGSPQQGSWSYNGTQIAPSAGTWTETVVYAGPNGQAPTSGTPVNRQWTVVTVLPNTLSGVDNDVVHTTTSLWYTAPTYLSTNVPPHYAAREIRNGFVVSGPSNDFSGITVGIIQTLTGPQVIGTIPYHNTNTMSPNTTGTLTMSFQPPGPPYWDGSDSSAPCYYNGGAKVVIGTDIPGASNGGGPGNYSLTYGNAGATPPVWLALFDSPGMDMPSVTDGTDTFQWGITDGNGNRSIGSNFQTIAFEDMLVASAYETPNVVVPIYGYLDWNLKYGGALVGTTWIGGSVSSNGTHPSTQPVADVSKGPANSKMIQPPGFTVP